MESFVIFKKHGIIRPFCVYLQMTNGIGAYDCVVGIIDLRSLKTIAKSPEIRVDFEDKLSKVHAVIPVPPIRVKHSGDFDLVVTASGQEIARQAFKVLEEGEKRDGKKEKKK